MDKILAFGILLVVLLTVFLLLNNVYVEMLVDMNNEVKLLNRKSAKIKSILAIENDLKEKVIQKKNIMKKGKLFLSNNNSTSAASELQNYLKKLITTYSNSKILTIKPYPVAQHDEYSEVSLEIRVKDITHKELQNVLYRIETKSPVLLVKELGIRKTKLQYKPLIKKSGNTDHLESIFVISGFFQDANG